jgi:hypothetical protein
MFNSDAIQFSTFSSLSPITASNDFANAFLEIRVYN